MRVRMDSGGQNFYPRPPRGGRRQRSAGLCRQAEISIHALREEGDLDAAIDKVKDFAFLSTPSARRATCDWPV